MTEREKEWMAARVFAPMTLFDSMINFYRQLTCAILKSCTINRRDWEQKTVYLTKKKRKIARANKNERVTKKSCFK